MEVARNVKGETVIMNVINRQILAGDVLDKLSEIESESIDCIISSPPYWGLRDYGMDGQLGLEPDFRDYLKKMSKIMTELKRVLKKTGTCWINLGDTYASSGGPTRHFGYDDPKYGNNKGGNFVEPSAFEQGIIPKSRFGIPERFYINCIDDGWIARNHIPWYKANAMPSSVKDRFTNKWESIFFFAKNQKYYFNLDAVREKTIHESTNPFNVRVRDTKRGLVQEKLTGGMSNDEDENYNKKGEYLENNSSKYNKEEQSNGQRLGKFRNKERKQDTTLGADGKPNPTYKGFNQRWKGQKEKEELGDKWRDANIASMWKGDKERTTHLSGKNPGDVFFNKSKPYAVIERYGTIYYRELPSHDELREYLNKARKEANITVDKLEEIWNNYTPHHWFEKDGSFPTREDWIKVKKILQFDDTFDDVMTTLYDKPAEKINNVKGKNPGDVFFINPRPFAEAHFATFPVDLPLKILKCACPSQVCTKCGVPCYPISKIENKTSFTLKQIKELTIIPQENWTTKLICKLVNLNPESQCHCGRSFKRHVTLDRGKTSHENYPVIALCNNSQLVGHTKCSCNVDFKPGIVLDPFFGAGTVGVAAEKLGLQWCGIELSEEYITIAKNRLNKFRTEKLEVFT